MTLGGIDRRAVAQATRLAVGRWLKTTLFVALAVLVMIGAAIWQGQRLGQRRAFNALVEGRMAQPPVQLAGGPVDPESLSYRRVEIQGTWDPAQEIVLRNRALNERPGVHVITPLRIAGSPAAVLVDRGWIPAGNARAEQRSAFAVSGPAGIQGIARPSQTPPSRFSPVDPPLGPNRIRLDEWIRVDVGRIQQQVPYPLLPIYVELAPAGNAAQFPISGYDLDLTEGPHLGYVIQWSAFAIIAVSIYAGLLLNEVRKAEAAGP